MSAIALSPKLNPPILEAQEVRRAWADIAKGLAIVHVVVAHVLSGLADAGFLNDRVADRYASYAYLFMMPCFFFLSGLFIERSRSRGDGAYLRSRVGVLVVPFWIWTLVLYMSFSVMERYTNRGAPGPLLPYLTYSPGWHLWFFYALFLLTVVYVAIRHVAEPPVIAAGAVLVSAAVAGGVVRSPWPIVVDAAIHAGFFAVGASVGPEGVGRWFTLPKLKMISVVAGCGAALLCGAVLDARGSVAGWVVGWAGVVLVVLVSFACVGTTFGRVASLLGRQSLEIYVAHTLFTAGSRITLARLGFADQQVVLIVSGVTTGVLGPLALATVAERLGMNWLYGLRSARGHSGKASATVPSVAAGQA